MTPNPRLAVTKPHRPTPRPFQLQQDYHMCCALHQYPVTDFMSDHPFSIMTDRGSSSPHLRREEALTLRTALPDREPSKEEIELAQRILSHAQAIGNNQQRQTEQTASDSPSPAYELQSRGSRSPSTERHQFTPRSASEDRGQRELSQPFSSATSPPPNSIPSGQVCRFVLTC